jgi:hypothetical protein
VTAGVHATRGDAIAIALAVVLVAALFAALWQPPEPAQAVEVRGTDGLVGRYGLERARTLAVPGPLGESEIRIADGAARFVASPCRNKVCVHRGWLRHRRLPAQPRQPEPRRRRLRCHQLLRPRPATG